jgi:hypothetical protein
LANDKEGTNSFISLPEVLLFSVARNIILLISGIIYIFAFGTFNSIAFKGHMPLNLTAHDNNFRKSPPGNQGEDPPPIGTKFQIGKYLNKLGTGR